MEARGETRVCSGISLKGGVSNENNLTGADLAAAIDDLSPTTQANFRVLITGATSGKVKLNKDHRGKISIDYKEKIGQDYSDANRLCAPQSSKLQEEKLEDFFVLIDMLNKNEPPSGIVFDRNKVSFMDFQYREWIEYEKSERCLGKGNASEGYIIVVKDKKLGVEHAMKTVTVCKFRHDEIRCWRDLNGNGHVPKLYMVRLDGDKVVIHMEVLEPAKTFSCIIEEHMVVLRGPEHANMVKPFSVYVLKGCLEALSAIHKKGWSHRDVHGGNLMLTSDMMVKIIDFGSAHKLGTDDFKPMQEDIVRLLKIFSDLYTGRKFLDESDMLEQYSQENETRVNFPIVSKSDHDELLVIMDAGLRIVHPEEVEEYKALVEQKLGEAVKDSSMPLSLMLRNVGGLLFPEICHDIHQQANLRDQSEPGNIMGATGIQSLHGEGGTRTSPRAFGGSLFTCAME